MYNTFEYDISKSKLNKEKHGIDFEEAKAVWRDEYALVAPTKQVEGEKRFIIIGNLSKKVWSVIFTYRNETIRIISARRARKEEVSYYEKNKY